MATRNPTHKSQSALTAVVLTPLLEDWLPVLLALAVILALVNVLSTEQVSNGLSSRMLPVNHVLEAAGSLG